MSLESHNYVSQPLQPMTISTLGMLGPAFSLHYRASCSHAVGCETRYGEFHQAICAQGKVISLRLKGLRGWKFTLQNRWVLIEQCTILIEDPEYLRYLRNEFFGKDPGSLSMQELCAYLMCSRKKLGLCSLLIARQMTHKPYCTWIL